MMANRWQMAMISLVRCAVGLIWIAGAVFNAFSTMRHPEVYHSLAAETTVPVYQWLFSEIVAAHAAFWTLLLVLGELFLGVLTLAKGRRGQVGLAVGALWSALLFPLVWPYTLMMGPYAVLLAWLATRDQGASLPEALRAVTSMTVRRGEGRAAHPRQ